MLLKYSQFNYFKKSCTSPTEIFCSRKRTWRFFQKIANSLDKHLPKQACDSPESHAQITLHCVLSPTRTNFEKRQFR